MLVLLKSGWTFNEGDKFLKLETGIFHKDGPPDCSQTMTVCIFFTLQFDIIIIHDP
jgi:hypothetical protein